MKTKSVKHITVKELCETADINRGTFYLHYKDVFDMLEKLEDEFFNELTEIIEGYQLDLNAPKKPLLEDLFIFTLDNIDFCQVMLSEYGDIGFVKKLLLYLHSRLEAVYGKETERAEHYYSYIMYGCIGIIVNWLDTGAKESPETMAIFAEDIIMNGISKFI